MDIFIKAKKPELDIEYYGQQSRFFEFFDAVISDLMKEGGIYAETNSGSNGNAYMFAKKGYKVITNDISEYSYSVAKAILSDDKPLNIAPKYAWLKEYGDTYIKRAAVFASLVDEYGYNSSVPETINEDIKEKISQRIKYFSNMNKNGVRSYKNYNMDLFQYLDHLYENKIKVDVLFMDFAWPWRDGKKTEEYETTTNEYLNVFEESNNNITEIWDKDTVIDNVLITLEKAKKVSKYVLLSNQSSNYPTPEILEINLLVNNFNYIKRHTMLVKSEYEDNLGKNEYFREYLYVIKGDLLNEN
ncbi:MAG: hypothetical protein GX758_03205 [Tenericutes bacterium]|nr:hypothetical protein [Mycoplasmatota bacterium]